MKKEVIFILFFACIFFLPFGASILISEIESNPPGSDSGNEWVEFYSSDEINLTGYILENNDGDKINLTDTFIGYYIYQFPTQWLDNTDEKLILHLGNVVIQETPLFDDSYDNYLSFNWCNSTFNWSFISSTKGQENNCTFSPPTNTTNTTNTTNFSSINNSQESEEELVEDNSTKISQSKFQASSQNKMEIQTIKLNEGGGEKISEPKPLKNKNYSSYYLISFCFLLVLLYLLNERKKKSKKNEFS